MKALYRRYRPKTLGEVVGQEQVTDILSQSLKTGKIAHAYLFIGPRGTGKTSVARIFAHEINGFDYQLEDDYLDIIEIDAASNTGVDNIRDLREKAIIAPTKGKYKIYIIDEVHMLSKSAFNALLKTLEEPPEHVIFIMATTDAHKVPITITSRSQTFTFKLANPSIMHSHLKKIAKAEKIDIDDAALDIIVKRGGGSFRDSLSLLDQISTLSEKHIDSEIVSKAFGLPQQEAVINILNAYSARDQARIRKQLQELLDTGIKAESIADNLIEEIMQNPQPIHLLLLDKLTDVSRSAYPNVKLLLALSLEAPQKMVDIAPAQTTQSEAAKKPTERIESPPQRRPIENITPDNIWESILSHVEQNNPVIYKMLASSDHELRNGTLTIYAKKKFAKIQIEKRITVINEVLPKDYTVIISDQTLNQDADIAAIAEIMGGGEEVTIND